MFSRFRQLVNTSINEKFAMCIFGCRMPELIKAYQAVCDSTYRGKHQTAALLEMAGRRYTTHPDIIF